MTEFRILDDSVPLTLNITNEQLLDFALEYLNLVGSDQEHNTVADKIITNYVVNELAVDGRESCTADEVVGRVQELLCNHVLTKLVEKDYLEADLTDNGTIYKIKHEDIDDS